MIKKQSKSLYGRTGGFIAIDNKAEELFEILCSASLLMKDAEGCIEYIIGRDITDKNAIWVFEVWEAADLHKKSLAHEGVRELISNAMPMIKSQTSSGTELDIFKGSIADD